MLSGSRMLKQRAWKTVYRTGTDNLLKDFYLPALERSSSYKRAVGYFTSELLIQAAEGVAALVSAGGKMQLVIGNPVSEEEYDAIKQGASAAAYFEGLYEQLKTTLESESETLSKKRLQVLAWMVATGSMEIKFAFRKHGMYHEKVGILTDSEGDRLIFQGSANETVRAMSIFANSESISVYKSWEEAAYEGYGKFYEDGFDELWSGRAMNTAILDLPSIQYEKIAELAPKNGVPSQDFEHKVVEQIALNELFYADKYVSHPHIPAFIGNNAFSLRDHQKRALNSWKAASYKGIMKLATGAGKTITAIYGLVKILEARGRLVAVIAVPYQELALQWVSNLRDFGITSHQCFQARTQWHDRLERDLQAYGLGATNFVCAVVVNQTLSSEGFQSLIKGIGAEELFFIGDECHRHGNKRSLQCLPDARLRMGLSATPFNDEDEELESKIESSARDLITGYYGPVVAEYTLGDAIRDGVLCSYEYYIHPVWLTTEEQESFEELSAKIAKLLSSGASFSGKGDASSALKIAVGQRSRLLAQADDKVPTLKSLITKLGPEDRKHALFYCAEGFTENLKDDTRNIDLVTALLRDTGWRVSRFTSQESKLERRRILDAFSAGSIDSLVSMKVLDEGIDIPACKSAYILASTRNPRQYVQRRGRILRKAEGKRFATIHDFMVLPAPDSSSTSASKRLIKAELERAHEFITLARNSKDCLTVLESLDLE